jgi:predicted RNA-binding Zn-ribbon protein involved in translation (DUF1610 family)
MLIWERNDSNCDGASELVVRQIHESLVLACGQKLDREECVDPPTLVPDCANGHGVGALIVPLGSSARVTRNGVPLASGAHVLRHADRLEYEGRVWWVAASRETRPVPYDAIVHGEDVHCFITKGRLRESEMIIICPGPAGGECGAIYREAAWEMVQQSNARFRCPRCGFDPAATDWQPALPRKTNLTQLFELARQRRAGGAV